MSKGPGNVYDNWNIAEIICDTGIRKWPTKSSPAVNMLCILKMRTGTWIVFDDLPQSVADLMVLNWIRWRQFGKV